MHAIDAATLLGDDAESFAAALDGGLAVVGPPFAGREMVLAAAADRLDAPRHSLGPGDDPTLRDPPTVIDGCHHLYRRVVGGFDRLDAFRDRLATVDGPVVTGWTTHAWEYLATTRGLDREFSARVRIAPLDAAALGDVLLDGTTRFELDDPDEGGLFALRRHELSLRGRRLSVPLPTVDRAYLAAALRDADPTPRDVVLERLAQASGGNLGVAAALWDRTGEAPVRPSDVPAPASDRDLDDDEAFLLRVLLAKERASRRELAAVVGETADRVVARLARARLVTADEGVVALDPVGVPVATAVVERRQLR